MHAASLTTAIFPSRSKSSTCLGQNTTQIRQPLQRLTSVLIAIITPPVFSYHNKAIFRKVSTKLCRNVQNNNSNVTTGRRPAISQLAQVKLLHTYVNQKTYTCRSLENPASAELQAAEGFCLAGALGASPVHGVSAAPCHPWRRCTRPSVAVAGGSRWLHLCLSDKILYFPID